MRSFTRSVLAVPALMLLVAVGCQRLNVDKTIHVDPGEVQDIIIDAPRSEQKVTVGIDASAPVDVYVILSDDVKAVKDKLLGGGRPEEAKVRAKELKVETATLEAIIPAKSDFRIMLAGAKKAADVKVKVTGK